LQFQGYNRKMKILVANDDGVYSPGIKALANAMAEIAEEVVIVAPDVEQSAASSALTLRRPLRYKATKLNNIAENIKAYRVDGTPADCVILGVHNEARPDLVVAGINLGPNLGYDIIYSGTVAAATEATTMGIPAIAFSIALGDEDVSFNYAQEYAKKIALHVLEHKLPKRSLLNVNFPATKPIGIRLCRQSTHQWSDNVVKRKDPDGKDYYWISGSPIGTEEKDADYYVVKSGYVGITPLHLDMTEYQTMKQLEKSMNE